jgi:hypothetical protein
MEGWLNKLEVRLDICAVLLQDAPDEHAHRPRRPTMYDYRILFPRLGAGEIRRDLAARTTAAERRRVDGCVRPDPRAKKDRS